MKIDCLETGILRSNCYLVEGEGFLFVIDPGDEADKIVQRLNSRIPTHIILTHAHFDHIGALSQLHDIYPEALICIGENEPMTEDSVRKSAICALGSYMTHTKFGSDFVLPVPDILLKDNQQLFSFKVLETPGHTMGSICLYDETEKIMFSGDTLFRNGYGRTDISGNMHKLFESLKRILALEDEITVYPGHNSTTTIKDERMSLIF